VALAEMAVRGGHGATVALPDTDHRWLFAESASRVLVAVAGADVETVLRAAADAGVPAVEIGATGGDRLVVEGLLDLSLPAVTAAWRDRLPEALGAGTAH